MRKLFRDIFKRGSTTYFYSSLFFPPKIKEDVFTLYAFVRTADDFVDATPQQSEAFHAFRKTFRESESTKTGNLIIDDFRDLMNKRHFENAWVEAFLDAMEADLHKKTYETLQETQAYMYGSAEVIGLMMASIMELPEESHEAARLLGRSMQYINFIRDVQEDNGLGRQYIPTAEIRQFGLNSLEQTECERDPANFGACTRKQIAQYKSWREEAEKGFHFIPKRLRVPIQTAANMYDFTARVITKNPMIVFQKKVKPSKARILADALRNIVRP